MSVDGPSVDLAAPEATKFSSFDWLLLLTTASLWGASFLFMDIALDAFEPGLITLLRVAFGGATLWALPSQRRRVARADWPSVVALGIVWFAFPLTMFPIAQQWIDSSLTGMLNAGMPVFTMLIGIVAFDTPPIRIQLAGVGIGVVGIGLIGLPEASTAGTTAVGVGLVLLAVMSYGVAINIAGPLQRTYGTLPVLRRSLAVATVLTLPFGLIDGAKSSIEIAPLLASITLGVGGTGVAFATMALLAGRTGAVRSSIVTYLIPVIAIALGVSIRDDDLSLWSVAGTAVVLVGAWVATRRPRPAQPTDV